MNSQYHHTKEYFVGRAAHGMALYIYMSLMAFTQAALSHYLNPFWLIIYKLYSLDTLSRVCIFFEEMALDVTVFMVATILVQQGVSKTLMSS